MQQRKVAPPSPGDEDRDTIVRKTELFISNMLRGGVLLSAAIIVMGVVMFFARYSMNVADAHPFPHSLGAVISGIAQADARSVIVLGLLVLLMTPMLRVAVSIVAFAIEHDWRYVVITAIVLCVSCCSAFSWAEEAPDMPTEPHILFFLLIFLASIFAGLVGSLVGLGEASSSYPCLPVYLACRLVRQQAPPSSP